MKIVRLVLLLSLVGVPAACSGGAITEPAETPAKVAPAPLFNGTPPDTTANRDSGHLIGSGN